jgi:NlpC/P60 family putative phage cell wall peptidase
MTGGVTSERIVAEALTWLATPYRHQGRRRGVGCDCLGLVTGVWEGVYGSVPERPAAYAADWAEAGGGDPLVDAARRHCTEKPVEALAAGDLILFRWRPDLPAKHCAIALGPERMIHAYEGHAVLLSPLGSHWRRRIAGVFAFPPLA